MTITFKINEKLICEKIDLKPFNLNDFIEKQIIKENKDDKEKSDAVIKNVVLLQSSIKQQDDQNNKVVIDSLSSNSFVHSIWEAYNKHYHIEISCDNIWMAIITQLSLYINKNSKLLKKKLIGLNINGNNNNDNDDTKKTLIVYTNYPILKAPFDIISIEMCNEIEKNITDPSIKELIIPNFSTTTQSDKVAFSIALMSTYKQYFEYESRTLCGIPKVTLLGTIDDYLNLKERVLKLNRFNSKKTSNQIKKWLSFLVPVIDEFIQSFNNPNLDWWNEVVDYRRQSGCNVLTGWLSCFCVFDKNGEFNIKETIYSFDDNDGNGKNKWKYPRVDSSSIANGFLSTPIKLTDSDGTIYNGELYSGHLSSTTNIPDKNILKPSIDWFIITK